MSKPLTVLQVLPSLQSGGVERGTLEVAAELVRKGHRSLVVSGGGRMLQELIADGSEHTTWDIGKKSPLSFRFVRPLRRLMQEQQVDIIHLRSRFPAWIARFAWKGLPMDTRPHWVSTVHGLHSVSSYSAIVSKGERVIAVSDTVKQYVLDNYPDTPKEHIEVIYRGVDRAAFPHGFQPPASWLDEWRKQHPQLKDQQVLTLAGRITRLKGHAAFIEMISGLLEQGLNVHGLIVGDEDPRRKAYAQEMRDKVQRMGLSEHVSFIGHRSDIREIYAISSLVFSLSSKPESFGRTVVEALSMGVPVIGWNHGGVSEILGHLYPQGAVPLADAEKLLAITMDLLTQQQPVHEFISFDIQTMLDKTLALYQELVE